MRKTRLMILPLTLLLGFASCEDEEETALQANPDVFYMTRNTSNGSEGAPVFYVYANKNLEMVTVTTPDQEEVELSPNSGFNDVFSREPSDEDYQTNGPEAGTYSFDVLGAGGEELFLEDELGEQVLHPVELTIAVADNILDVEWTEAEGADRYALRILEPSNGSETEMIRSNLIEGNTLEVSGYSNDFNPRTGNNYIVELRAFLFENVDYDLTSNIQAVSVSRDTIKWE